MKSRMERYSNESKEIPRSSKNQDLYENIYTSNVVSSNVTSLENESEIDISKVKELIENRDGYKRLKGYDSIIKTPKVEVPQNFDSYEDTENKMYDINEMLEKARSNRTVSEREKYRTLRNTQYNILSKLDLSEAIADDKMDTDFFTKDKTIEKFLTAVQDGVDEKSKNLTKTALDLFEDLKGEDNTILTEAVNENTRIKPIKKDDDTFYTSQMNFTKQDFEGFQNLQKSVKKNNRLIKFLVSFLVIVLLVIIFFAIYTFM